MESGKHGVRETPGPSGSEQEAAPTSSAAPVPPDSIPVELALNEGICPDCNAELVGSAWCRTCGMQW